MPEKKKLSILVVEDIEEIMAPIRTALTNRGYHVVQASTADQAIEMAEADRPAMILTELQLPTFDKLMFLLRRHDDLKNLIVAIIDGNHPNLPDQSITVLSDFQALDDMLQSPTAFPP